MGYITSVFAILLLFSYPLLWLTGRVFPAPNRKNMTSKEDLNKYVLSLSIKGAALAAIIFFLADYFYPAVVVLVLLLYFYFVLFLFGVRHLSEEEGYGDRLLREWREEQQK